MPRHPPSCSSPARRCLCRHDLNTRAKRLSLVAGYRAPYEPPRPPRPEPHINVERPGELVGVDCFYVGRLRGTTGAIWQLTAIDCYSSYAWAELVVCKHGNPTTAHKSTLARRVAGDLKAANWRLERVLLDNGNEYCGQHFHHTVEHLGARITHIHAGRPQTQRPRRTTPKNHPRRMLATRLRPPSTPASAANSTGYRTYYNHDRTHPGRRTHGRILADLVYRAHKMDIT